MTTTMLVETQCLIDPLSKSFKSSSLFVVSREAIPMKEPFVVKIAFVDHCDEETKHTILYWALLSKKEFITSHFHFLTFSSFLFIFGLHFVFI